MAGRHAAGADEPFEIKPLFTNDAEKDFETLSNGPDRQSNEQYFILENGMQGALMEVTLGEKLSLT